MLKYLKTLLLGFIALSVAIVAAQETCAGIIEDALLSVDDLCGTLGRNQACYGNVDLSAEAQPDVTDFIFETSGDVVDVADIFSLELSDLNEDAGTWGVAVMSLQADIPNTLPGQNVTFILFGDVSIENASTDEQTPMQAFYLRTGVGSVACEEAPESGLLIQTPDGVDEVTFNVNGVDVQIGSTVLFQTEDISEDETDLLMSTVEGSLAVQFDDEAYPVIEGTSVRLPLNNELLPTGRPGLPQSYEAARIAPLPLAPLPRQINPAQPLAGENLNQLHERLQNNQAPCGVDGLPPCDHILPVLQSGENLAPPANWGTNFELGVNCIARPATTVDAQNLPPVLGAVQALPFCPPTDRASRPAPIHAVANNELPFEGDADEDGVPNAEDACPLRAGNSAFTGCTSQPVDTDGDGLVDALDYCPYQAGDPTRRGCNDAPRDADNDGFPDALDFCPNNAGTAEYRGCPDDPRGGANNAECAATDANCSNDRDGDGVPNRVDRCPMRPGTRANYGCPDRDSENVTPTATRQVDSDGDGFADGVDRCPNHAGTNNGCPPDSDGDGLYDPQDECPNQVGPAATGGCPPPDSDGDGVPDGQDQCPNHAGTNNGCPPDSDGDGLYDPQDQCPNQVGPAATGGCPPPDSDGDGVPDGQDQCPNQAGPPGNGGCPPPDRDGDGIPDGQDQCPDRAGPASNGGCPPPTQPPAGGGGNDADGDGVPNGQDQCPLLAGPAANNGCPAAGN